MKTNNTPLEYKFTPLQRLVLPSEYDDNWPYSQRKGYAYACTN